MILDISKLPKQAVYLVMDEVDRSFYVGYTLNMGGVLPRLYEMGTRLPTLELRVLVATSDLTTLKLHTEYYRNIYLERGYSELESRGRKTLQYNVRVVVAKDFKYVDVELVSARGDGIVVARFLTKKEASDFVMVYYGTDNPYRFPVYASNSLTKEFLAKRDRVETFVL